MYCGIVRKYEERKHLQGKPVGAFFVGKIMEVVSVMCPRCKKFLTKAKNENRITKIACRKCWKWIWYNQATGDYEIREIPLRESSSGIRFW